MRYKLIENDNPEPRYFKTKKEAYEWAELSFGFGVMEATKWERK